MCGWQGLGIGGGWQGPAERMLQYRGRWLRCRLGGCDIKGALPEPGVRGHPQSSVSHTHFYVLGSRQPSLFPNLVGSTVRILENNLFSYRLQWPFHPPESPGGFLKSHIFFPQCNRKIQTRDISTYSNKSYLLSFNSSTYKILLNLLCTF